MVFSTLVDEKYFVYRSIIPNYKKNNGIKESTTLVKVTGVQSTVLSFLGFSRNVSGQKLLVYHILILIHRGAKLYSQERANLKILNSAPGLNHLKSYDIFLQHWSLTGMVCTSNAIGREPAESNTGRQGEAELTPCDAENGCLGSEMLPKDDSSGLAHQGRLPKLCIRRLRAHASRSVVNA